MTENPVRTRFQIPGTLAFIIYDANSIDLLDDLRLHLTRFSSSRSFRT